MIPIHKIMKELRDEPKVQVGIHHRYIPIYKRVSELNDYERKTLEYKVNSNIGGKEDETR